MFEEKRRGVIEVNIVELGSGVKKKKVNDMKSKYFMKIERRNGAKKKEKRRKKNSSSSFHSKCTDGKRSDNGLLKYNFFFPLKRQYGYSGN